MKLMNNIKISAKLPIVIVLLSLLTGCITAFLSYNGARAPLKAEAETKLSAVLDARVAIVQDWLVSLQKDAAMQAVNPTVRSALVDFTNGWDNLQANQTTYLQEWYIDRNPHPAGSKENLDYAADDTGYSAAHAKYHPYMREFLRDRGYYDIFLFDARGNLVYSVYKEADFATNLLSGPWARTDLGNAYRAARNAGASNEVFFFDLRGYEPSNGAPASFISTPVTSENGTFMGALVIQIPTARMNTMMQNETGLGETGETYIVGKDLTMRSESRFSGEGVVLERKIDTAPIRAAAAGESGVMAAENYNGTPVISAYQSVEILGVKWGVVAEQAASELFAPVTKLRNKIILQLSVSIMIIVALGMLFARDIAIPLGRTAAAIKKIGQGDYKAEISSTGRGDEIGEISNSLVAMRKSLAEAEVLSADAKGKIDAIGKSQATIEFDLNGTIKEANDNFLAAVGYSLDEIKGKHHSMFVDPEYSNSGEYKAFWDALRRGEYQSSEFRRVGKGGKEIWIQASYNPILGPDGKPDKVVKFASDITDVVMQRRKDEAEREERSKTLDVVVSNLASGMKQLAEGNLTSRINVEFSSEFEQLRLDFNETVEQLQKVMGTIVGTAEGITSGASEISKSADDLSRRTEDQAGTLEETAAALDEITATVNQTSSGANEANSVASETRGSAQQSGEVVREAVDAMGKIESSSNQISQIIGVIDDIAFQTNLLALNAGVEAARAGDAGRGFAVVAQEVRALAQRSSDAAKEIKELISASSTHVSTGVDLVHRAGQALEEIVGRVENVSNLVSEIATSAKEQSASLSEVNTAVNKMDKVTQQNAAMVEESTAASHSLTKDAADLSRLIAHFNTGRPRQGEVVTPAAHSGASVSQQQNRVANYAASTNGSAALKVDHEAQEDDWQEF